MTDIGLRGLALLDAAIAQIEAHPETWNQQDWRCESGMCVAGWMAQIAGGEWLDLSAKTFPAHLYADPDDPPFHCILVEGVRVVHAEDRAGRLLGVRPEMDIALGGREDLRDLFAPGRDLFAPGNTLDDIKIMRDDLYAAVVDRVEVAR